MATEPSALVWQAQVRRYHKTAWLRRPTRQAWRLLAADQTVGWKFSLLAGATQLKVVPPIQRRPSIWRQVLYPVRTKPFSFLTSAITVIWTTATAWVCLYLPMAA